MSESARCCRQPKGPLEPLSRAATLLATTGQIGFSAALMGTLPLATGYRLAALPIAGKLVSIGDWAMLPVLFTLDDCGPALH